MLIAMTGRKRHGKDSVAEVLAAKGSLTRIAFAGTLKGMIRTLLMSAGMSEFEADDHINGSSKESELAVLQGKTTRYAMQTLGTEWRDMLGKDLWTDITKAKIEVTPNAVITDMRFLHEEAFIDSKNGVKIRVIRSGMPETADLHPSEIEQDSIVADFTIYNYGSLDDLTIVSQIAMWGALEKDLAHGLEMTTKIGGFI